MSTSHDQSTNLPLVDLSTERHSDPSSKLDSPQSNGRDPVSPDGEDNNATQLLPPNKAKLSIWSIVGGYVVALALAVGHHVFLRYLHGRDIDYFSQLLVKGASNGFSTICSICIGFSVSSTLTQMKWRVSGSEPLPMYTIDKLFALPAPLAILKTLMRPRRSLLLPILSSVLIQAVVLIGILAPTALSIGPSEQVSRNIQVPIFDLSQYNFVTIRVDPRSRLRTIGIDTHAEEKVKAALFTLPDITWTVPSGCGRKCAFYLLYSAPVLDCHDVTLGDAMLGVGLSSGLDWIQYKASTNLSHYNEAVSPCCPVDAPYDLSIHYAETPAPFDLPFRLSRRGAECRFYWGTYNASFELNTNSITQRVKTSIISRGDYLSIRDTASFLNNSTPHLDWPGSWAICYAFADAFQGDVTWGGSPLVLTNFFNTKKYTFELAVPSLSEAVAGLFSNLTLALISARENLDHTVLVNATVWDGTNTWIYTTWILWVAYLPALLLAAPLVLYGLVIIHVSGRTMDDTFTSFFLATRNAQLDDICKEAANFEELQRFRLSYGEQGTFLVDSGIKSET